MEIHISEASGVPFYRQIKDQIAAMIRSGVLVAGEKLPSVRELASKSLVSLITIRRAYSDLEADGLIVRRQGHGTFVSEEIEMTTHEEKLEEGRKLFAKMVVEAEALGLSRAEIAGILRDFAAQEGAGDE